MSAHYKPTQLITRYSGSRNAAELASPALPVGSDLQPIKATILVVDDEPSNQFAFSTVLEELDEHIVLCASGKDALRFLLRSECAVILLDVNMPDIDGYQTAELIRAREKCRQIPIIFISAINKDDTHIRRAYSLGAVDYVFKPIDPVILKSKVAVFVELFKRTAEVRQQALFERRLQAENSRVRAEKLEAERALRRAEEQQASIVRSLPIVLYSVHINDGFRGPRFLGERMSQAIGFTAAQFIADLELWVSRIHPDDLENVLAEMARIKQRGAMAIEYRWRCADGSERFFLDRAVLIRDDAGRPQEIFGSCLDVTDRREAEQRWFQSQKMEAVGQLTGGLAHDFNNMLTVVIGNLDALGRALKGAGRNADRVQMALTGAMSCADLTRRLLAFASRQPLQPSTVNFSVLISNVVKLLDRTLGENIQVSLKLPEDLWHGVADAAQVESALMNLAVNARDAMASGGVLCIEAKNICIDDGNEQDHDAPPGSYVMLAVNDNGCGMTAEIVERAFEPFFTTKPTGRGTGLGLSMVYGFVKQSGGHVKIESAPGVGTTVRLYLPKTEHAETIEINMREPEPQAVAGCGRTVLLVEDDAGVRAVTAAFLRELQFNVLEAENAIAALPLLRDRDAAIDLLFTDVVMPGGMSGVELVAEARRLRADLPVLLTSGYSESFNRSSVLGELLPKPYREADLLLKLQQSFPTEV